jgi:hypothetical protein
MADDTGHLRETLGSVLHRGEPSTGVVDQLRVVLAGISPLIWRRLLVAGDTSIAALHEILQTAFGWSDEHLHRCTVHGVDYGVWRPGSAGFSHDPRTVRLAGFRFRTSERFTYEYDLTDGWRHDIRVEKILAPQPGKTYPVCTGGARSAPPEDGRTAAGHRRFSRCVNATPG